MSKPGALYVEEHGAGPAVVLLHSFLCSGEMWAEQVPALAERHRVLNVDLPGHGRSPAVTGRIDLHSVMERVVQTLDGRGVRSAVWCGLSIGGMIALRAALEHPDRVTALALLDSHAGPERLGKRIEHRLLGLGARVVGMGPFLSTAVERMFGSTTIHSSPELVADWRARFRRVHVPSMLRYIGALNRRESLLHRLREIQQPALVLVGEEDRSLPPSCSRAIHNDMVNSEYREITGAGHLSALERPEEVTPALLEFLDRVVPGTGPQGTAAGNPL